MSELGIYKIVFVVEILIAIIMFSFKFKKRKNFILRGLFAIIVCLLASFLFPLGENYAYTWWYSSIMFVSLFLLCVISMFFVFDVSWQRIFFISITSYTIQHLSYEVYGIVAKLFNISELSSLAIYGNEPVLLNPLDLLPFFVCFVIYLLIYTISFIILEKKIDLKNLKIGALPVLAITGMVLFSEIIFNSIVVYSNSTIDDVIMIIISLYNIVCCLIIICFQFSIFKNKKMEIELVTISQLLQKAEDRYKERKENVDLINLKCHDLKYQIRNYGESGNISKDAIEDISEMIKIYDSAVKTGNESLDLILSEKSLLCKKQNINLKCFADCSKLNFMSEADIYTLFGNAVDNAIEAVTKIKDVEKRHISLIIRNVLQFISISIDNYFDGDIKLDKEGFPKTTKNNKDYHGYGIKSIQLITEKYNGNVKISLKKDVFSLRILIPIDGSLPK